MSQQSGRPGDSPAQHLLTTPYIVFLVVAAAAPLAAMLGNLPIAISRGSGVATPVAFVLAGLTLIAFTVGYGAIGRRLVSTGAFYTYIARGLGKPAGVGGAYTAVACYTIFTIGLAAACGYFDGLVFAALGMHISWQACAAASVLICGVLAYRSMDVSAKLLAVILVVETAVLIVFDASVIAQRGWAAFPLESFAPSGWIAPGIGVSLMTAFTCFVGFESGALYSREAADPARSIPLAGYISVALIGGFYLFTAWVAIGALTPEAAVATARSQGGDLLLNLIKQYDGETMGDVTGLLLCTSLLASYLAIHSAATRYVFALSRERLLPVRLGRFHPTRYAPSAASMAVSAVTAIVIALFSASPQDPYDGIVPVLIGLGTLGIVTLQTFAAVAILAYLVRRRRETSAFTLGASAVAMVGLATALAAVVGNFTLLATSNAPFVAWLPLVYVATIVGGFCYALRLRHAKPALYRALVQIELRPDGSRKRLFAAPRDMSSARYCIIGAGPAGLVAARALRMAGVPYDHFERHRDVGGIWDIANPGSPVYRSTHLISSKHLSGFPGFPMPAGYPDYPGHRDVLAYIRAFAASERLLDPIRFETEVRAVAPRGRNAENGWQVTTAQGDTATYSGVVCATGANWHPRLPAYPGMDGFEGELRHSASFKDAREFEDKRVLIVGGGNSAIDIACEAARTAKFAAISMRRAYHFIPKHLFGVPTDLFFKEMMRPPPGVVVPDDADQLAGALFGDLTRLGLPPREHKVMECHPVLNSDIVSHLTHGRIEARPDVLSFDRNGVAFVDGRRERFDLILFATGYAHRLPYLDEALLDWNGGRPDLYLNVFHPTLRGLSVIGNAEFAGAAFPIWDEMAQMVAMDAVLEHGMPDRERWREMKSGPTPDLTGGRQFIESERHAGCIDTLAYQHVLGEIRERFGWPDPTPELYA